MHAQADYPKKMLLKYSTIARANAAWGTQYPDWNAVRIPVPGTRPGAQWQDVLLWYRDTKRAFIDWQIGHYQRLLAKYYKGDSKAPQLMILVPGTHVSSFEWDQAVASGGGGTGVVVMADSEFLLDRAHRTSSVLQYTGLPNMAEVEYLEAYMREHGYSVPMWGENAGNVGVPKELGDEVLSNGLVGQEYIGSNLFQQDHVTPSPILFALRQEYAWLRDIWQSKAAFRLAFQKMEIVQSACIRGDIDGRNKFCLDDDGTLTLFHDGSILWANQTRTAVRRRCWDNDSALGFKAVFQGDGNLVVYCGGKPLWASQTNGRGRTFVISSVSPYVQIFGSTDRPVWSPNLKWLAQ
jgi:hypothetical protein